MDKYVCNACGYIYDPAVGDPDNGIAPGTPRLRLCRTAGCVRCAASARICSARNKSSGTKSKRSSLPPRFCAVGEGFLIPCDGTVKENVNQEMQRQHRRL